MNSFLRTFTVFLILVAVVGIIGLASTARALEMCIDPGAPVSASTGDIYIAGINCAETGASWARINCIVGPWNGPTDTTLHGSQNMSWFDTYDSIVDDFIAEGLSVYMLIGAEAVKNLAGNPLNSAAYVAEYSDNFETIVNHFKDRVTVYESFNEPNDWAGGSSAQVTPYYFALMLQEIYTKVKLNHWGAPEWMVTLISGPLFTHDADNGAAYMNSTYSAGISSLSWQTIKDNPTYNTYPLDGIGFHLYVAQGSSDVTTVQNALNTNLNATWSVVTSYEGAGTAKQYWISEMGWRADAVTETGQATNLDTAFNLLRADSRVYLANWFNLMDFPGNQWGLYRSGGFSESNKRPSWYSYFAQASSGVTPYNSDFITNTIPGAMLAGSTETVIITIKNTGSNTWSIASAYRLGAGSAGTGNTGANEFIWLNWTDGGYSITATDQRAFLGGDVSLNDQTTFTFDITAPVGIGTHHFAARMVQDGVAWFGDALDLDINVTATGIPDFALY